MGVIDQEFKRLEDVVSSLEDRVKRLEQRQSGDAPLTTEGIRMILMGPPGAGAISNSHVQHYQLDAELRLRVGGWLTLEC